MPGKHLPDFFALFREHLHQISNGVLSFGCTETIAYRSIENTEECSFISDCMNYNFSLQFLCQKGQSVNRTRSENKKLTIWTLKNISLNFKFKISWSLLCPLQCLTVLGTPSHITHTHRHTCTVYTLSPALTNVFKLSPYLALRSLTSLNDPPNFATILPRFLEQIFSFCTPALKS